VRAFGPNLYGVRENTLTIYTKISLCGKETRNDPPDKLFHASNPFVWRPSQGRHTCLCGAHGSGATHRQPVDSSATYDRMCGALAKGAIQKGVAPGSHTKGLDV
jgi:hypothetical protein